MERLDPDESQVLFRQLQDGDSIAESELFQRYVERLLALARSRMSPQLRTRVGEDDVVQSVYRSFFTRAKEGSFILERSGDLWRLLATITLNKVRTQAEFHGAKKRAAGRELPPASEAGHAGDWAATNAAPEDVLMLEEEVERVMRTLPELHRQMLASRLQGDSIPEIAIAFSRTEHQIRRVLNKVRSELERRLRDTASV